MILPVAERELRVASRRRSTSWTRVVAAGSALLVGSAFILLWFLSPATFVMSGSEGRALFDILKWLTFAATLLSGLFLTSDSISEEKREGTLGLLFLTDLRGHDVVTGKLLATSLVGFYGLLAVFPILGLPLLMGGVTGADFWRTVLALLSTMLLSLGMGMFASVVSREPQKALTSTLAMLAAVVGGGFGLDELISNYAPGIRLWRGLLHLSSPASLLHYADGFSGGRYLGAWIVNLAMTITFFLAAVALAPRTWQDRARREHSGSWWARSRSNLRRHSVAWRRRMLSSSPIAWLMLRDRWQAWLVWIWAFVCLDVVVILLMSATNSGTLYGWHAATGIFTLLFYLLASQAGRFFVESRQNGVLELLLSTPVSPRDIIYGQWRAWVRRFIPPIAIVVMVQAILSWAGHWQLLESLSAIPTLPPPPPISANPSTGATGTVAVAQSTAVTSSVVSVTISSGGVVATGGSSSWEESKPTVKMALGIVVAAGLATTVGNLCAVFWFGLWLGLTGKRAATCSLRALLFVQVIPWLVFSFISSFIAPLIFLQGFGGAMGLTVFWYMATTAGGFAFLSLVKDGVFIVVARRKLLAELRVRASGTSERRSPQQAAVPPPLPTLPVAPAQGD